MYSNVRIGEIFIRKKILTVDQVEAICSLQLNHNKFFGELSVELGLVSTDNLLDVLSNIFHIKRINLNNIIPNKESMKLLSYNESVQYNMVIFDNSDTIKIAVSDPGQLDVFDKLRSKFQDKKVDFFLADKKQINMFLSVFSRDNLENLDPINLLNSILFSAIEKNASDLHFEPITDRVIVRMRIDGVLNQSHEISFENWKMLQSRLKILADLDITEQRLPQSGHVHLTIYSDELDLRVSTHPGISGENIAVRILNVTRGLKRLDQLKFQKDDIAFLQDMVHAVNGIFLIVGPTGAGKTTTLYALLQELDQTKLNIMTLEDPIEYQIKGIKQLDLCDENLISYADGIKSILRQDPDVILVGEIRDESTAAAVLRAALTGRLVLATLHAATPIDALRRLADLGIDPKEFAAQTLGIFTQRLVRGSAHITNKTPTTYSGRWPICEWLRIDNDVRNIISKNDYNNICLSKTFQKSISYLLEQHIVDPSEITRVMGHYGDF